MVIKASIASIPSCGQFAGGNAEAPKVFSKRELCLFAAEMRLAIEASRKPPEDEVIVIE